jgi:hypothetical protein
MNTTTNKTLSDLIAGLTIHAPLRHRNLTVFPLTGEGAPAADYLVLDEALERGLAHITEVSEAGSVPELAFENDAERDVLLLDGEELVGARQNRILNISILVGAKQKLVVPVSCVERGRWSYLSREFGSAGRKLYAKARAAKMAQVSRSMQESASRASDQSFLWQDLAEKRVRMAVASHTEAMADLYEAREDTLDGYRQAFAPLPGQVGAVFAVDGELRGVEILDTAQTFARFLDKLVGSYAMDAIDTEQPRERALSLEEVGAFLAKIGAAQAKSFPALGKGEDLRLEGDRLAGGALLAEGRVVHLAAFALDEAG